MGVSFFETMRGELLDEGGLAHACEFEIKAESTGIGAWLRAGRARITGVVDAPPWADQAPLEGTVHVSPVRRRAIAYDFRFRGGDDVEYRLAGQKDLRWNHPVSSLTELAVTLWRVQPSGVQIEVARGELRFDLNDLKDFLRSWSPTSRFARQVLDRPDGAADASAPFDDEAADRLLRALAEATIAPGLDVPEADALTFEKTRALLRRHSEATARGYGMLLRWLDAAALWHERRRFADLDLSTRRALLERLATPGDSALERGRARLVDALTAPIKMMHFDRADYHAAIGHPRFDTSPPKEKKPRYFQRVTAAEDLEPVTEIRAEVVVVGTGAGGAPLAASLASQGFAVAMLEEGRYRTRHDFVGSPIERVEQMWRNRGMNLAIGTPIVIPTGRVVGGTTTINSGTCFPTPDEVLLSWRRDLGFPDDFTPASYGRYSEQVAHALGVGPGDPPALGRVVDVIGRGADALGLDHSPLPRNAPGCTGAGVCVFGCPEGAKRSTDVSFVPKALEAGAALFTGLPATRILMHDSRAVGVEARGSDAHGAPRVLRIMADAVVLACGTLATPLLLRDNGFGTRLPRLGRNLSVHPGLGLLGMVEDDLEPWSAIPQGYGVEGHGLEGVRYEGYYMPPQFVAPALPYVGAELTRWMDRFRHVAQFGFMVRDAGDGSVHRGPGGRPLIRYKLSGRSIGRLVQGSSLLAELLLEAGASEVYSGIARRPTVRTVAEARALRDLRVSASDFSLLGAHPLGTCAMGESAARGVVDFEHRVFGTDNLYVVDGSSVPTSLGVNPQMTIMAMALRAADLLAASLRRAEPAQPSSAASPAAAA